MTGDAIDLLKFPTPLIYDGDGGRYIQSFGMNIAKTPDGSWTNWSINRMMLVDHNRLACLIPPPQHLGMIRAQWTERGEDMPYAIPVAPLMPTTSRCPSIHPPPVRGRG
ncbi:UbiD family decarboxylase domain-containing protein [Kitasatospora sp. NPDC018058]|uniref:UbiD family decarboxylase domain-containing protein n=1 Tax=Kitasatospora sp. NPDC018058 TaxID=3364025 RepID=UPI0037BEFA80